MAIWSRDKRYSGVDGNGSFNADVNLAENNDADGFLKKLFLSPISTTVTGILTRNKWLRTMFFKTWEASVDKIEDKTLAADLGVATESTIQKYVAPNQLPNVLEATNNFTITTVPADGVLTDTQPTIRIQTNVTGTNKVHTINLDPLFVKALLARIIPSGGSVNNVLAKLSNDPFDVGYLDISTLLPSVTASKLLYVNAANINDGDGSVLNPFKTLELLYQYIIDKNLEGAGYTILVYGGNYTTNRNLSNGNQYYFYPAANVTYTGSSYLFDSVDSYNINIFGYGNFLSSTGGIIRSEMNSDIPNINIGNLVAEFNSITHTHTGSALKLSGYYSASSSRKSKTVDFNTISSSGIAFDLGIADSDGGANAEITGKRVSAPTCVKITNLQNNVNFNDIVFVPSTSACRFESTTGGSTTNFKNCEFYTNSENVKMFDFSATFQFNSSDTHLYLLNSKIKYGSSSSGTVVFNLTLASTNDVKLQCVNFIYPSSGVTLYSPSAGDFIQIYPAGVITYAYNDGE